MNPEDKRDNRKLAKPIKAEHGTFDAYDTRIFNEPLSIGESGFGLGQI